MNEYVRPELKEVKIVLNDIIADSFDNNRPGDVVNSDGYIW